MQKFLPGGSRGDRPGLTGRTKELILGEARARGQDRRTVGHPGPCWAVPVVKCAQGMAMRSRPFSGSR